MPSSQHAAGVGFSLVAAPVLYHLEYDSSLYKLIQVGAENVNDVDYAEVCCQLYAQILVFINISKNKNKKKTILLSFSRFRVLFLKVLGWQ